MRKLFERTWWNTTLGYILARTNHCNHSSERSTLQMAPLLLVMNVIESHKSAMSPQDKANSAVEKAGHSQAFQSYCFTCSKSILPHTSLILVDKGFVVSHPAALVQHVFTDMVFDRNTHAMQTAALSGRFLYITPLSCNSASNILLCILQ